MKFIKKLCLCISMILIVNVCPINIIDLKAASNQDDASNNTFDNYDEAVSYVRNALVNREETITITLTGNDYDVFDILNDAMKYERGAAGNEGDYLKRNTASYRISFNSSGAIVYTIVYRTTAEQEAELSAAIDAALKSLNLDGKSTYEKIKSIYDYICDNVNYDYEGLYDKNNTIKYTAYSAMINKKAVCDGYASLFYRMCMESGISTRVITGSGNGGAHAWNIVEINGYYYNVDVTWDGQDEETRHNFFLKCDSDFIDHVKKSSFETEQFLKDFPMSSVSYVDYSNFEQPLENANPEYFFSTLDGETVSSSSSGKPKILIFFSNMCYYSKSTIKEIANQSFDDVDIICLNILNSGNDTVTNEFRDTYGNSNMKFCSYSGNNSKAMWKYVKIKFGQVNSISLPLIVYVDSNNNLQHVTSGQQMPEDLKQNLNFYCHGIKDPILPHGHIYSDKWITDEISHWHICIAEGCNGATSDKAVHTASDWIIDKQATTTTEGSHHKECTVCGYVMEKESIAKLHTHEVSENWTCDHTHHWHVCATSGCGEIASDKAVHTAGDWIIDKQATTTTEGSRHKECTVCGYVMEKETINRIEPVDDDGNVFTEDGWHKVDGIKYWYEKGVRQGYDPDNSSYRGKEIYDPITKAWYWLDNVQLGAVAKNKDVYQESLAGEWGDKTNEAGEKIGKWVRYDENGHMIKGWDTNKNGTYYFDTTYGTMAKGTVIIDGKTYNFDKNTGALKDVDDDNRLLSEDGWHKVNGVNYWYENGIRQGYDPDNYSYRGKEIYDPVTKAWYWLDNVQLGAVAKSKDVYQESLAGEWGDKTNEAGERIGKWVRYDENGHMVKGWDINEIGVYYFDPVFGTMAKGEVVIDGQTYYFDKNTGVLQ